MADLKPLDQALIAARAAEPTVKDVAALPSARYSEKDGKYTVDLTDRKDVLALAEMTRKARQIRMERSWNMHNGGPKWRPKANARYRNGQWERWVPGIGWVEEDK